MKKIKPNRILIDFSFLSPFSRFNRFNGTKQADQNKTQVVDGIFKGDHATGEIVEMCDRRQVFQHSAGCPRSVGEGTNNPQDQQDTETGQGGDDLIASHGRDHQAERQEPGP